MIKTLVGAVVTSAAIIAGGTLTAFAADITVPIDTVITGGVTPGEQVELSVTSSGPFEGSTCRVQAVRSGDGAARAGNDLAVTSGGAVVTLVDVERESAAVTDGSGSLTLGEVVTVELTMGADGSFDGDITLEFTCGGEDAAGPGLPVTGTATNLEALLGAVLVVMGGLMRWMARRPATETPGR